MGGERASTTRQREAGQICAFCRAILESPPERRGERLCPACDIKSRFPHPAVMNFMLREGWSAHFIAEDCETPLSRYYEILNLVQLCALVSKMYLTPEDLEEFEDDVIQMQRGSVSVRLTDERFRKLEL